MLKEAQALVGPGSYEGLSPFEAWLCENVDDLAVDTYGNVDAPAGWFARAGRYVVVTDDRGFWYVHRFATVDAAKDDFEAMEVQYDTWDSQDDSPGYHQPTCGANEGKGCSCHQGI